MTNNPRSGADKIRFRRGDEADLPQLDVGEPGYTTDTKRLFIGAGTENIEFAKQSTVEATTSQVNQTINGLTDTINTTAQNLVLQSQAIEALRDDLEALEDDMDGVPSLVNNVQQSVNNLTGAFNASLTQIDTRFNNIAFVTPTRQTGETSDSPAIARAIAQLKAMGGGYIRWRGTLEITAPIVIDVNNIYFSGIGETATIKAMATISAVLHFNFPTNANNANLIYENFKIDGNNLAAQGIRASGNQLVRSVFRTMSITNVTGVGILLDVSSECIFTTIDISNCGGGIRLVNGASYNYFLKCEVRSPKLNALPHYSMAQDDTLPGYALNLRGRMCQNNVFDQCKSTNSVLLRQVHLEHAYDTAFLRHNFSADGTLQAVIYLHVSTQRTVISGSMHLNGSTPIPIINEGFGTKIEDFYVSGFTTNYLVTTINKVILKNVTAVNMSYEDTPIQVTSTWGDVGDNLHVERNALYSYNGSAPLHPGQFMFDGADNLRFRTVSNTHKIAYDKTITNNATSAANAIYGGVSATLPDGLWEISVSCWNADYSQGMTAVTYIAVNNGAYVGTTAVTPVKEIKSSSNPFTLSGPSVTSGVVSANFASSVSTTLRVRLTARPVHQFR